MARNIDSFVSEFIELQRSRAELAKIEKDARQFREQVDAMEFALIKKMRNSTEADFQGKPFAKVENRVTRSATIALVMEHAPELKDSLIKTTIKPKIKFI